MDEPIQPGEGGELVSTETRPFSAIAVEGSSVLIPHMTEEEVDAGIASFGKKMIPVVAPDCCTPNQFKQIIAITFACYMRDGAVPDYNLVADILVDVGRNKVQRTMGHPIFRYAMKIRGVEFNAGRVVTPEQDMAIAIMGTPNGKTFEQKLKAAGVAPSKWRAWLKQTAFKDTWLTYTSNILSEHENDMLVALVGQAVNGDVPAIKYAFEVSGKHNPAKQQNVDVALFLNNILEILQQEIKDTETLSRIAARMQLAGSTPGGQAVVTGARAAILAAKIEEE